MTAVTSAVGWALLHFVWQGALVAVIFAFAVRLLRTPEARYALGVGAMLALLALPVVTAARYASGAAAPGNAATRFIGEMPAVSDPADALMSREAGAPGERVSTASRAARTTTAAEARAAAPGLAAVVAPLAERMPLLVAIWLAGVFLLSLRLFDAWLHTHRLSHQGTRPADAAHRLTLERIAGRLRIRRPVTILESTLLCVPAVVGWLRPVVLLPAVALTGMTAQQVEALIAHELAHVKRHDFLANIVQSAIETLLFYHPAVWYVSRRVREAREHCCDDIAVRVSGRPDEYARALLGLAEGRARAPVLVAAATGAPLLARIRRIVLPDAAPPESFPRWIVGAVVLLAAALFGGGSRVLGANEAGSPASSEVAGGPAAVPQFPADTDKVGADTVLHAPPGPLAARWQWARDEARGRGYAAFWVGYLIEPLATAENRSIYMGRLERQSLEGGGVSLRGRIVSFGDFEGFRVPGVRLAPIVGGGMPDDVAVLFLFVAGRDGRPRLARVHASSLVHPVDLEGRAVMWLGRGTDAESVPIVRRLFDDAPDAQLREDVVAMVGVHATSSLVVPVLLEWVEGRAADDIRTEAVEWLGRHPVPASLHALARSARRDRSADVRREAAESVGELALPVATDTLIALARTLDDADARREAVEGLGERADDRSVDALAGIVRDDRDPDIQREGAESLGESGNPKSVALLIEIARTHPVTDVRREAVESIGENLPAERAVPVLSEIARTDRDGDIRREAIETLGEMKIPAALAIVDSLASSHPDVEARREAVETLGEASPTGEMVARLARLAQEEDDTDVVSEAVETIAETQHPDAPAVIADLARTHRSAEVRRVATERLAEVGDRGEAVRLLGRIAAEDADSDVRREAVESLGELPGRESMQLLARFAQEHSDLDARREAVETLGESAPAGEFVAIARLLLESDPPEEVWHEVVESLAELKGGEGIPVLISTARSHASPDVRKDAFEALAESDDPRARRLFDEALER